MSVAEATERPRLPLWAVVVAGGVITALSLGVRSTFGLLVGPIAEGVGSDLGSISLAIAIQNLVWGFSQPIAGGLSDRFGAPRVLAAGGLLYMVAMVMLSTAQSAGMVILSGGFIAGIAVGAASFAVVLSAVGRMVPPERRSLMLGIVSAVGSLGQFVLIPLTRVLLDRGDWQQTTLILGLILIAVIAAAPAMKAIRIVKPTQDGDEQRTDGPTLSEDLRRARRSRPYLLLNAAFFVCGFHVTFIGVHLPGHVELVGLSATTASTALALIGLFNVFGSLLVGAAGQRFAYTKLLAGIYAMRAVVITAYILLPVSSTSTIIFAMAMGVLWLSTVPPTSAMVTEMFGPKNSGALFGVVFLSHQMGSFIGAWLGGEVVDIRGTYSLMWWAAIALGVFAMAMHLLIKEGPTPHPPASAGGRRAGLAPLAVALFVVTGGTAAGVSVATTPAAATITSDTVAAHDQPFMTYCALGPIVAR